MLPTVNIHFNILVLPLISFIIYLKIFLIESPFHHKFVLLWCHLAGPIMEVQHVFNIHVILVLVRICLSFLQSFEDPMKHYIEERQRKQREEKEERYWSGIKLNRDPVAQDHSNLALAWKFHTEAKLATEILNISCMCSQLVGPKYFAGIVELLF